MVDTALYGWEPIKAYHTMWLQQLEYDRAECADNEVKMEFMWSLVWHLVAHGTKVKLQLSAGCFKKHIRENLSKVVPATPQTGSCTQYTKEKCRTHGKHVP